LPHPPSSLAPDAGRSGIGLGGNQPGRHSPRRDVDAAHFEHVVGAPAVGVVPVGIEAVLVPATRPRTLEGVLGAAALVPVHDRRGRAADLQLAELAWLGDDVAVVVYEPHLPPRDA